MAQPLIRLRVLSAQINTRLRTALASGFGPPPSSKGFLCDATACESPRIVMPSPTSQYLSDVSCLRSRITLSKEPSPLVPPAQIVWMPVGELSSYVLPQPHARAASAQILPIKLDSVAPHLARVSAPVPTMSWWPRPIP